MIKKLKTRINRLELQKQQRIDKRKQLDLEIGEIDKEIKQLNTLKKDYEKLQSNMNNILNGSK